MKHLISILSLFVLTACGGGGGSNSAGSNDPTSDSNRCANMPETSCTYALDDLSLSVSIVINEENKISAHANFSHPNVRDITLSGSDKIEIHAGGQVYQPSEHYSYHSATFENLTNETSGYEVYWWRDDIIVAHGYVDRLPNHVGGELITADEATDNLSISWMSDVDFVYDIHFPLMWCTYAEGEREYLETGINYYPDVNSPFDILVTELSGPSMSDLKTSYNKCEVLLYVHAEDSSILPVNYTDKEIEFRPSSYNTFEATLFEL